MKKKTSLKDIAEKVGVSTALVSYVLNNKKKGRINKEVASKIKAVAKELNYSPNQLAKGLRTNKTNTIGLIVADIANPFFSSLARILEDEAEKHQYTMIFGSSDESAEKSWKLINVFLNRQVDGLIIASAENTEDHVQYLQEQEIPFVLIDRYFPGLSTNYVAIDNREAAALAVQHLQDHGYRRIGFITYASSLFNLQERKKGYQAALAKHNKPDSSEWLKELAINHLPGAVGKAIDELLRLPEPVDAIIFASNTLSTIGLKYINTLAVKVPEDVAIISFDESDAAHLFYAPLTHIRQPLEKIGQEAVQILLKSMTDKTKITQHNMSAELVAGKSTAPVLSKP